MHSYIAYYDSNPMNKNDFTSAEYAFFDELINYHKNFFNKYGENYRNKFNCNKKIKTSRLILQPFDDILDKKYCTFFLRNKYEYENYYGHEYSKDEVNSQAHQKYAQLSFAVLLKQNNEFIGSIALNEMNDAKYHLEYYIKPEYRKNGYAFEAVQEILKRAFNNKLVVLRDTIKYSVYNKKTINAKCIYARVDTNNLPSIGLLEKLGFKKDGILKYDREMCGKFFDSCIYTLEKNN